jgi:hypothetical protein
MDARSTRSVIDDRSLKTGRPEVSDSERLKPFSIRFSEAEKTALEALCRFYGEKSRPIIRMLIYREFKRISKTEIPEA